MGSSYTPQGGDDGDRQRSGSFGDGHVMHTHGSWDDWSHSVKSRDWVGSLAPWGQFVGWPLRSPGGAPSWSVPKAADVADRVGANVAQYMSNYAVVFCATLLYMAIAHPFLFLWGLLLFLFSAATKYVRKHRNDPSLTAVLSKLPNVKPEHVSLAVSAVGVIVLLTTVGHALFEFVGVNATIFLAHAMLRSPKRNPKKDDYQQDASAPDQEQGLAAAAATGAGSGAGEGQDQEDVPRAV